MTTEIRTRIVVDTSDIERGIARLKEYIDLKKGAGFDTSSDLAAMWTIIEETIGEKASIPQTGDGDGRGGGTGDLFADEDRGWERLCPADSGPLR